MNDCECSGRGCLRVCRAVCSRIVGLKQTGSTYERRGMVNDWLDLTDGLRYCLPAFALPCLACLPATDTGGGPKVRV